MTRVDLKGADPRSIKELTDTLAALKSEWPGVEPVSLTLKRLGGGVMGQTDNRTSAVQIDRKFASDYDDWQTKLKEATEAGRLHKGIADHPASYTMVHEFGHVLTTAVFGRFDQADMSADDAIRHIVVDSWKAVCTGYPYGEDDIGMVPAAWMLGYGMGDIERDLTMYATASPEEMIAEGFAVHRKFGPGTSKIADLVMTHLTAGYEAKFGKRPVAA